MTTLDEFEELPERRRPPATTPKGRENQLISLAYDQAELLLREGKAPAPVVVHFLKLATEEAKLQQERMRAQIELDKRKAENIETAERLHEMYEEAKKVMLHYQGNEAPAEEPEDIEYYD